jgi:hypothetical protein
LALNLVGKTTVRSPATAIGWGWNHLIPKLTQNQIQLVVKAKKKDKSLDMLKFPVE